MARSPSRELRALRRRWWWAACLAATLGGPVGCTEFRSMPVPREPEPRGGAVEPRAGETALQALERAVRSDAARAWRRSDGGAGLFARSEPVTWRDGALGCPLADRMYSQATVRGWRILVSDGNRTVAYHASADGRWVLCPPERVQPPAPETLLR